MDGWVDGSILIKSNQGRKYGWMGGWKYTDKIDEENMDGWVGEV